MIPRKKRLRFKLKRFKFNEIEPGMPLSKSLISHPSFRYVAPFTVFMVFTEFQRWVSGPSLFWLYGVKSIAAGSLVVLLFAAHRNEIAGRWDLKAVFLGIAVAVVWIAFFYLLNPETEPAFNPEIFSDRPAYWVAVSVRILGAAIVVPVIEELFWRSFLMRVLIKSDFMEVPMGAYVLKAFWLTVVAFTLVHRFWEWPGTILAGVLYGFYLVKTKNLVGCMIAHGTTNLILGIYVVCSGELRLW